MEQPLLASSPSHTEGSPPLFGEEKEEEEEEEKEELRKLKERRLKMTTIEEIVR